jgi:hypothetical protein
MGVHQPCTISTAKPLLLELGQHTYVRNMCEAEHQSLQVRAACGHCLQVQIADLAAQADCEGGQQFAGACHRSQKLTSKAPADLFATWQ